MILSETVRWKEAGASVLRARVESGAVEGDTGNEGEAAGAERKGEGDDKDKEEEEDDDDNDGEGANNVTMEAAVTGDEVGRHVVSGMEPLTAVPPCSGGGV